MKYSSLNKAAVKVTQEVLNLFEACHIDANSLIAVKPIQKIEEFGFIGVQVLYKNYLMASVTVDIYNNNIADTKIALQYLSTRINKMFEDNVEFYGKHI